MVDDHKHQPDMQITVQSSETRSSPPPIDEPVDPIITTPVQRPQSPAEPAHRLRDKEIIIIEREGGNVTKNISINIESAIDEGAFSCTVNKCIHNYCCKIKLFIVFFLEVFSDNSWPGGIACMYALSIWFFFKN